LATKAYRCPWLAFKASSPWQSINRDVCVPLDGAPSTHILKPDSESLYGGVQNEALCLVLARRCGLNVAEVTIGTAGKRTYLLVSRYDRQRYKDRVRRLHQEDYCQALGRPPSAKYKANQTGMKGPTLSDVFALTRNAMSAADTIALLDAVIFNVLICNTDARAKNYSLMITSRGFKVAPIYDVMCANVWDGVTKYLAQKIAGKIRGEHLKRRHWMRMAEECGLNATRLVVRIGSLATRVTAELDQAVAEVKAMPAGCHGLLDEIHAAISKRCRAIIGGLADKGLGSVAPRFEERPARPAKSTTTANGQAKVTTAKAKITKRPSTAK
jgi:serine/threonine-protein kinase HipA